MLVYTLDFTKSFHLFYLQCPLKLSGNHEREHGPFITNEKFRIRGWK